MRRSSPGGHPHGPVGRKKAPGAGTRVLAISELAADLARRPATAPEPSLHPDHLCYVIHTSGSTGDPKAVAVSHGSLACVIGELVREYRIAARDRVVQWPPSPSTRPSSRYSSR